MRSGLGDFTTNGRRLTVLSGLSLPIGALSGVVAFLLLRLIGLITNVAYFGSWSTRLVAADPWVRGPWAALLIPVVGGLLIGVMARYGTDKIRGHGIPEAIQSILDNGSRMEPRVALIKPIASAITIGTGGPFGAEGPIIMTGGALGSLISQYFPLSSLERRTILVAGAAGGMSATFAAPISSVLLAVELLLFEWRPRSLVPVALASVTAYAVRVVLLGSAPVFGTPAIPAVAWTLLPAAVFVGVVEGTASGLLTKFVYWVEDLYHRLPIHWMWWPAIGGLAVGLGGLVMPQALGVGYPTIRAIDAAHLAVGAALALLAVKAVIWVVSLSSGTSGGVLAPLLMIGGALGLCLSRLLPGPAEVWAIAGMAAMLGGTMRAPFTATLFTMETTHNWPLVLLTFAASLAAMVVTVLWIPRSILTEKVARRGTHVAREYAVHPLEGMTAAGMMVPAADVETVNASTCAADFADQLIGRGMERSHGAYPVLDHSGRVTGIVRRAAILASRAAGAPDVGAAVGDLSEPAVVVRPTDRVRSVVEAMARTGRPCAIVEDGAHGLIGFVTVLDLNRAWQHALSHEEQFSRTLHLPRWRSRSAAKPAHATGGRDDGGKEGGN